jgi:hypothetical protein
MSPGSVIVRTQILEDPLDDGPDPHAIAADLAQQAGDQNSLLKQGTLTRHTQSLGFCTKFSGCPVKAFARWAEYTLETKQLKRRALKVVQRLTNRILVGGFGSWWIAIARKRIARRVVVKMSKLANFKAFERWCEYVDTRSRLKIKAFRILVMLENSALVKGFDRWKDQASEMHLLKSKALKIVQKMVNRSFVLVFELWQQRAADSKLLKSRALKVVQKMVNHSFVLVFELWQQRAVDSKLLKFKLLRAVQKLVNVCLVRALATWILTAEEVVIKKKRMKRAVLMMMQQCWVSKCRFWSIFLCWRLAFFGVGLFSAALPPELNESMRRGANVLRNLMSRCAVVQHMTYLRQADAFRRWKSFCQRRDHLWRVFAEVSFRWERLSLSMPFKGWSVSAFEAAQKLRGWRKVVAANRAMCVHVCVLLSSTVSGLLT